MKKTYKYKIGQIVRCRVNKYTIKECPTCGNKETNSHRVVVEAKIISRRYDFSYSYYPIVATNAIQMLPGINQNIPYRTNIKPIVASPFYVCKNRGGEYLIREVDITKAG